MDSFLLIVIIIGFFAGFPWSIFGVFIYYLGAFGGSGVFLWLGTGIMILSCLYNLNDHLKIQDAKERISDSKSNDEKTISDSKSNNEAMSPEELKEPVPSTSWLMIGLYIFAIIVVSDLVFDVLGFIFKK
jgi:hypothetical protein